ncbi:MAG: T9SS type A sorting domain-containing protein [Ignavibacteriaceae bacterium]|jgi:hypothetical protein|nr:MAG: T9SS C-terminal target domain-containing protein [Chlorobiota bacterium]KXK05889.1 MAG: peptidase S8/S53 subtilisin kexin sedolisin [Chlorobi bacterium OLB4]MBV6398283.1 hypothetical protein [Ignavibacteria bacterium]MCC6886124.1 T9SS type A sorting domain-containing protein [Ignavibacteriales bacterium]MCE7952624.1 T9SS C-terminal target domain-containing protein [Chlorobi bacterium CHB7]MDL1886736.1 T9SS type A sorting domain-containing protein [Ignavibacteria bacterium CHB1]MEB2329
MKNKISNVLKYIPAVMMGVFILISLGFGIQNLDFNPVTIQQIQFKSNDSLAAGKDKSDMMNDSVEIVGRVVAPPRVSPLNGDLRTLLRGQNSYTTYIQDTNNQVWGGIIVRQGTRNPQTGIDFLDTGQVVRLRGVVQEYGGTNFPYSGAGFVTQIAHDTASGYTVTPIGTPTKRPDPILVNVSDFGIGDYPNGGSVNYIDGEKYEGMYVEIRNVTVAPGIGNRQPWSVVDANGNKLYFRDYSNFFTTDPNQTLDTSYNHPSYGTQVNYIRGVIIQANNEGAFGSQLPYAIVPIYPSDLSLGATPPFLSNPLRIPGVPTPSDQVIVSTTVNPGTSPIASVQLLYRSDGSSYNSVSMTPTGNIYSGTIPAFPLGTLVEYFFRAEDNSGGVRTLPADTSVSTMFYKVLASDSMSVQDVQFCPNNGGRSAFEDAFVRGIEGIVTSDTSDIPGVNYNGPWTTQNSEKLVIIQNGQGEFSGIWLYGASTDALNRGDLVRVKGTVEENFGMTRINIATPSDIQVLSVNNPLPPTQVLSTSDLSISYPGGDLRIEKWEAVLLKVDAAVSVSCVNGSTGTACTSQEPLQDTVFRRNYGEIYVRDASGVSSRIKLNAGRHPYTNNWDGNGSAAGNVLVTKNDEWSSIGGILYFSYNNWKLIPRDINDFGTFTPVGISVNSELVHDFRLSQNYPNPFNPETKINFTIPVEAFVSLKVYDLLGREMETLMNQPATIGSYTATFNGSKFASGVYFYRLVVKGFDGQEFISSKRMVLVK